MKIVQLNASVNGSTGKICIAISELLSENNIENYIFYTQGVSDYYDLFLTEETTRYVFRILALKEIMENSGKYGFQLPNDVLYDPIKTKNLPVTENIPDLAKYALDQGINYKILKLHNPWMRDTSLTITPGKSYVIQIPTEGYKR